MLRTSFKIGLFLVIVVAFCEVHGGVGVGKGWFARRKYVITTPMLAQDECFNTNQFIFQGNNRRQCKKLKCSTSGNVLTADCTGWQGTVDNVCYPYCIRMSRQNYCDAIPTAPLAADATRAYICKGRRRRPRDGQTTPTPPEEPTTCDCEFCCKAPAT